MRFEFEKKLFASWHPVLINFMNVNHVFCFASRIMEIKSTFWSRPENTVEAKVYSDLEYKKISAQRFVSTFVEKDFWLVAPFLCKQSANR